MIKIIVEDLVNVFQFCPSETSQKEEEATISYLDVFVLNESSIKSHKINLNLNFINAWDYNLITDVLFILLLERILTKLMHIFDDVLRIVYFPSQWIVRLSIGPKIG